MRSEKGKAQLDQSAFPMQEGKLCPSSRHSSFPLLQTRAAHPPIHPLSLLILTSPAAVPRAALGSSCPAAVFPAPLLLPHAGASLPRPCRCALLPAALAAQLLCRAQPSTCARLCAREVTIELSAISESDERDFECLIETQGKSFFPKGRRVKHCFRINLPSVNLPHHGGRGTAASSFVSMFEAVSWFISATAALQGSPSPPCL